MSTGLQSRQVFKVIPEWHITPQSLARLLMILSITVFPIEGVENFKQKTLECSKENMRKKWQDDYQTSIYFVSILCVVAITIPLVFDTVGYAISLLCIFISIPPITSLAKRRNELVHSVSWKTSTSDGQTTLRFSNDMTHLTRMHITQIIECGYVKVGIKQTAITFERESLDGNSFLWVTYKPHAHGRHERYCIANWSQSDIQSVDSQPLTVTRSERRKTRRKSSR